MACYDTIFVGDNSKAKRQKHIEFSAEDCPLTVLSNLSNMDGKSLGLQVFYLSFLMTSHGSQMPLRGVTDISCI